MKCFVCHKEVRGNLMKHVWSAHKKRTEEYLKSKRKHTKRKSAKTKQKLNNSTISKLKRILSEL